MVNIGKLVSGRFQEYNPDFVTGPTAMAAPGNIYELQLSTASPMSSDVQVAAAEEIWTGLKVPGMGIIGIEASGSRIRLQVSDTVTAMKMNPEAVGPEGVGATSISAAFPWSGLIEGLPAILSGIGIIIAAIIILLWIGVIPGWAWGVAVVGGTAVLVMYALASFQSTLPKRRNGYRNGD